MARLKSVCVLAVVYTVTQCISILSMYCKAVRDPLQNNEICGQLLGD